MAWEEDEEVAVCRVYTRSPGIVDAPAARKKRGKKRETYPVARQSGWASGGARVDITEGDSVGDGFGLEIGRGRGGDEDGATVGMVRG